MDHSYFLWMSYAATGLALVTEIVLLRMGRARARQLVDAERGLEAQD